MRLLDADARATFVRGTDRAAVAVRASLAFEGTARGADLRLSLRPGDYLDGRVHVGSPRAIVAARDEERGLAVDCVFGAGDTGGARQAAIVRALPVGCESVTSELSRPSEPVASGELAAFDAPVSLDVAVAIDALVPGPLVGARDGEEIVLAWADRSFVRVAAAARPASDDDRARLARGPSSPPARAEIPRSEPDVVSVAGSYRGAAPVRPGARVFAEAELATPWAEVRETAGDFYVHWMWGADSVLIERAPGLGLPAAIAWIARDDVAIPTHENVWSPELAPP